MSKEEIALSAGVSLKLASKILQIYDNILTKHEDFYLFSNAIFRNSLTIDFLSVLSKEMILVFEGQNNFRRINELLHVLYLTAN